MNTANTLDFDIICRICLKNEPEIKSLFASCAAHMLNFCQFLEVNENDELPSNICITCHKSVQDSYDLKQKCIISNKTLKTILENASENEQSLYVFEKEEICTQEVKCTKCNMHFSSEELLNEHILNDDKVEITNESSKLLDAEETNDNDKTHFDENKTYIQNSDDELTSFLEARTTSWPYKCTQCTQSFIEEKDLNLHKSTHTSGDPVCVVCNKNFRTRQMLKRHMKIHMVHKPHICQHCGKGYAESHSLTKHMRKHLGIPREKKHFCDECGQGFSEPYYLNVHIRKHTGERPLKCEMCDKSFADPRSLKAHNMMHSGEKPYKCHICSKSFSQSVNLTKHIRVHTGEKPYICTICDKTFTQSSSLQKHHRTHTGEKPFACDSCPKRFAEKGTLIHHIRTHTGEKPYVCEICGKSFASLSELKLHDRKHSGIKKNICNVCGKDFATPSNLLVHTRSHTGEKPFECSTCNKKFADKGTLNKHRSLIHSTGKK
ncbi:zinc finger protein 501-like [Anoplophora glabripennis]|uniref:zinc finger protein 501-like n=1 Tax=Anoplophora glabripennis TaxID=217634 RepID=UPI00087562D4|nr:zinc finger protein 501-like [Anoplophora glabripennis]